MKDGKALRIVYMGTPDFAVASLRALAGSRHSVVSVVTAPDRPAGRGLALRSSAVKEEAERLGLPVLQPPNLKEESFINQLQRLHADLIVVVAFRMLPAVVWKIPPLGTINLHASLLPRYRGAAPIHHAIINGEKVTGLTTFYINDRIDTGDILLQQEITIAGHDNAGTLHDRLTVAGAELLLRTVNDIAAGTAGPRRQDELAGGTKLPAAPRLSREGCRIDWRGDSDAVYNFIRGLSPSPCAWTQLRCREKNTDLRIYSAERVSGEHRHDPGTIVMDGEQFLAAVSGGFIRIISLQAQGKKRMSAAEFLRGFDVKGCTLS